MEDMNDIILHAAGISKSFGIGDKGHLNVLEDICFQIREGEFVSILGPSGCGKSTFLNILAGFEGVDEGHVTFRGDPIRAPSPERAVVFQSPVLFPWLNVENNITYGLKLRKESKKRMEMLVSEHIKAVGLTGFEKYYPSHLSGGMQQRVALARVLILGPKLLLMDEPFVSLDAQTRYSMQQLLLKLWADYRHTVVFVTHDVEEALIMSDRIYIMSKRPGRFIEEIAVPFERPRSISITGTQDFSMLKSHVLSRLMDG